MADDQVSVYLVDRAGPDANAFGEKLSGRDGIELVGGSDDIEEALSELGELGPDIVLVSTDFAGAGCVSAVESVITLMPQAIVVMLSTRGDKALVQAGMRTGAAGSLDRNASPGETITALHVHKRRRLGEDLDLSMAEPAADEPVLRVSGALPVFPGSGSGRPEPGVEVLAMTDPAWSGGPTDSPATAEPQVHRVVAPEPPGPIDGEVQPVVPAFDDGAGDDMEPLRARLEQPVPAEPKRGFRLFGRRRQPKQAKDWGPASAANGSGPEAGAERSEAAAEPPEAILRPEESQSPIDHKESR